MQAIQSVNIRPGVSILSVLPHLNYKPWFALAEFVDNSVQSFLQYRREIERVDGSGTALRVNIEYEPSEGRISVRDSAAGIHEADYARAFRPAALPPDRSGLSEYGMGMKSAACWFSHRWSVRTKALDERLEKSIHFDIDRIVHDDTEELGVGTRVEDPTRHYTEIVLTDLYNPLRGRTLGKVKDHLASIYRIFLRNGSLVLTFDGDSLSYSDPRVLVAPYYKDPAEPPIVWHKDIDIDLGLGMRAFGFAALRETASTSSAGFALFRRNRLIVGSADEAYRPAAIFGAPNSYIYQRLFGELHLNGFDVSHTKDGFKWQEHEDIFLELLKDELNKPPLRLLRQAEEYRARLKPKDLKASAETATERTAQTIERELPRVYSRQLAEPPDSSIPPEALPVAVGASRREIQVEFRGELWRITIELAADPSVGDWIELCDQVVSGDAISGRDVRKVGMRLSLTHPFMERFAGADAARIEPLLRIGAGLLLAEVAARSAGVARAGTIRRNLNELMRDALSKP